jgi:hypothetical protein
MAVGAAQTPSILPRRLCQSAGATGGRAEPHGSGSLHSAAQHVIALATHQGAVDVISQQISLIAARRVPLLIPSV